MQALPERGREENVTPRATGRGGCEETAADRSRATVLTVDPATRGRLLRYLQELEHWNRRLNLTRVPADVAWTRHVEESLDLITAHPPAQGSRIADLGSGGGIPGLVVAIARPDVHMTLIEADSRKAAFLMHCAGLLELESVGVEPRRAEEVARDPDHREAYDVVVTRAAGGPSTVAELSLPLLRIGGSLLALVANPETAADHARGAAELCGGGGPVPGKGWFEVIKLRSCPLRYPRRVGVPARRPL